MNIRGNYVSNAEVMSITATGTNGYLCPDLLRIENIGSADGWRGHVVRAFFRVLKWLTGL